MTTPQITIYDAITGETIEREMNDDELAQLKKDKKQAQLDAKSVADKQATRQTVLDKLGLTADEAAALFG